MSFTFGIGPQMQPKQPCLFARDCYHGDMHKLTRRFDWKSQRNGVEKSHFGVGCCMCKKKTGLLPSDLDALSVDLTCVDVSFS